MCPEPLPEAHSVAACRYCEKVGCEDFASFESEGIAIL